MADKDSYDEMGGAIMGGISAGAGGLNDMDKEFGFSEATGMDDFGDPFGFGGAPAGGDDFDDYTFGSDGFDDDFDFINLN